MFAFPSTLITVVFAISLSSLYCNALLANLNGRTYILGETVNSPASDNTEADKQSGEVKFISLTHHVSFHNPIVNPGDDWAGRAFGRPRRW